VHVPGAAACCGQLPARAGLPDASPLGRPAPTRCAPTPCCTPMCGGRAGRSSRRPVRRTSEQDSRCCRRRTGAPVIATPPAGQPPSYRPACGHIGCAPGGIDHRRTHRRRQRPWHAPRSAHPRRSARSAPPPRPPGAAAARPTTDDHHTSAMITNARSTLAIGVDEVDHATRDRAEKWTDPSPARRSVGMGRSVAGRRIC
jgi:hypothetical protein